eukprot:PhF_6_TR14972/c0_g1_i7/m.23522
MPTSIGIVSVIALSFIAASLMIPSIFTDYNTTVFKLTIYSIELRITMRFRMVGTPDAVYEICSGSTCATQTISSSSKSSNSSSTSPSMPSSCSSIDTRRIVSLLFIFVGCFFGFCASVMLCCYVNTTPPPPYPMMQFPQSQPPPPSGGGGGMLHTCIMISLILQFCLCATAFGLFTHASVTMFPDCLTSVLPGLTSTVTPGVGLYLLGVGVFLSLLSVVIKLYVGYGIEPLGQPPGPYDVPMMTMSHPGGAGGYTSFPSNNNYGYRGGQGNMLMNQPPPSYQQQMLFDTIQVMTSPSHSVYSPGGYSNNNYVSPTNQHPMYQPSQMLKNNSSGYYPQPQLYSIY